MRVVLFYHSLVSDWNHGNAHFLRGVVAELLARGHDVRVFEPEDGWSRANLVAERGPAALTAFARAFPALASTTYALDTFDLDRALSGADLVIAHEWNDQRLLSRLAQHRRHGGRYPLLFHDTHHRAVSDPDALTAFPLEHFDGVLAFGASLREQYLRLGWGRRVWVWHEAADTRVFQPRIAPPEGDVVWIGNWGDDERAAELREYLIEPVRALGVRARIHGVRYPDAARSELTREGIDYAGWIPNHMVPDAFGRFHVTVHVPRRPYLRMLPGIPTIRPFEALACAIPLISAPWDDVEGLFRRDRDYLQVSNGAEMTRALRDLLHDGGLAATLASNGLGTILSRHTCAHRVDELLTIVRMLAEPPVTVQRLSDAKGSAPAPP